MSRDGGSDSYFHGVGTSYVVAPTGDLAMYSQLADTLVQAPAGNVMINPAGNLITDPAGNSILPQTNYDINIGMLSKKYLTLHAAELWVETLVAQNTIATIGGRVLVAPTNTLVVDLSPGSTSIEVKYNNFNNGDRVYMEANGQVEFMAIASSASPISGHYSYAVTRNLDGSGANQWYAGDALLNTGTTGNGFIDLYSTAGVLSGSGPTIVGNVRTGTTYNDIEPRWAIGNLDGLYGYSGSTYGAAFGTPSAAWVKIDPTNGVRLGHNSTVYTKIDASGNASFSGDITVDGSLSSGATGYGVGAGWWLDYNGGTPQMYIGDVSGSGNYLAWNGANVGVVSFNMKIDGSDGVGNVSIGSTPINVGRLRVASQDDTSGTYGFIATNASGIPGFYTLGDGTTYIRGPLYMSSLVVDTTGAGTNPGMSANGPFGSGVQPMGWMNFVLNGVSSWLPIYQ